MIELDPAGALYAAIGAGNLVPLTGQALFSSAGGSSGGGVSN